VGLHGNESEENKSELRRWGSPTGSTGSGKDAQRLFGFASGIHLVYRTIYKMGSLRFFKHTDARSTKKNGMETARCYPTLFGTKTFLPTDLS
jgi:hypothetical protein